MKLLFFLEKYLAAGLLRICGLTWRKRVINDTFDTPAIYAFWHRYQIPVAIVNASKKAGVLISSSKDGELIAGPLSVIGYKPIRGSSTRGGTSALRKMIKCLEKAPVGITPDGPKGPIFKVKMGTIQLARLSKKPIIPMAVDVKGEWLFNSWDKFIFPKPFAKIYITYGEPFYVSKDDDMEEKQQELNTIMENLAEGNKIKR